MSLTELITGAKRRSGEAETRMSNNVKLRYCSGLLTRHPARLNPSVQRQVAVGGYPGNTKITARAERSASRIEGFRKTSAQLAVTGHDLKRHGRRPKPLPHSLKIPNSDPCSGESAGISKACGGGLTAKYNRLTDSVKRQQRELAAGELIPAILHMMSRD